jgi:hypothetical protein
VKEDYKCRQKSTYDHLIKNGLSENEATYVVNKISNAIRQCGDRDCCNDFKISVAGKNDENYKNTQDTVNFYRENFDNIKSEIEKELDKFEVNKKYETKAYINFKNEFIVEFIPKPLHIKISKKMDNKS